MAPPPGPRRYRNVAMRKLVPRRVAEPRVDAVGLLARLLRELDTACLQLLVAGLHVVGGEEEAARGALGQQAEDLLACLVVEHGRPGHGHERDRDVGCPGTPTLSQRKLPSSGTVTSVAELHSELLRVEGERLVLVVHPDLRVCELLQHVVLLWSRIVGGDVSRARERLSSRKLLRVRAGVRLQHARRDANPRGRGRVRGPVGGGGDPERAAEARGERPDAAQPDGEADVRDRAVGVAQQRRRPLQPARQEVLVRRLAEGPAELAAEVRGREVRGAGERRHVELLAVAGVGEVLRAEEVPRRRHGPHGLRVQDGAHFTTRYLRWVTPGAWMARMGSSPAWRGRTGRTAGRRHPGAPERRGLELVEQTGLEVLLGDARAAAHGDVLVAGCCPACSRAARCRR